MKKRTISGWIWYPMLIGYLLFLLTNAMQEIARVGAMSLSGGLLILLMIFLIILLGVTIGHGVHVVATAIGLIKDENENKV